MALRTSKPSGRPSWPFTLVAGVEGSGKTEMLLKASESPDVAGLYVITLDEEIPHEQGEKYDYDIVDHDGTYEDLYEQISELVSLPIVDDRPHVIGIDTGTALWQLVVQNQKAKSLAHAVDLAVRTNKPVPTEAPIVWEDAERDWYAIINLLRTYPGPVIMTARYEEAPVRLQGVKTDEIRWQIKAHRSLVYDVSAVIEMFERGSIRLTKIKSSRFQLPTPASLPEFTFAEFWRLLGVTEGDTATPQIARPVISTIPGSTPETREGRSA